MFRTGLPIHFSEEPNKFSSYLVWLLVVLSFIGTLISIRLRSDMNAHGTKLKSLAAKSGLSDYFTFGAESGWTTDGQQL